jgi:hypothetical protein
MIESLGKGDQLVEMEVSSEARRKHPHLPTHFDVRAIRYRRKGYPPRTLLTSLVDSNGGGGGGGAGVIWVSSSSQVTGVNVSPAPVSFPYPSVR